MGVFADVTHEFKGAQPKERTLIIVGVVVVAGVAYYLYTKQHSVSAPGQPSGATTNPLAGWPSTGSGTPIVPSGVNPIYDASGNLVGWQNPAPNNQQPGPGTGTSNNPSWLGNIPLFSHIFEGGADSNGQRWWFVSPGSRQQQLFYMPAGSKVWQGGAGRWWYTLPGGQQQQLTAGTVNPPVPNPTQPIPITTPTGKSTPGG
jgi:hypothetical protein